jgi:formylglycine-generating enzyme required for sulfatase activity
MRKRLKYILFVVSLLFMSLLGQVAFRPVGATTENVPANAISGEEVYIPAGSFGMGCAYDLSPIHCDSDADPVHMVYLDAYYIDKLPVTNAQYAACQAACACPPPLSVASYTRPDYYTNPQYASYPMINVRWAYAYAYCAWAGQRLPTEAEWEKAARGTDLRWYPWGNELPTCTRSNVGLMKPGDVLSTPCVGDTVAVGLYPQNASPYGVLDMVGNVRQFVNDYYMALYYDQSPYYNPTGPATDVNGKGHFARGASWSDQDRLATTWVRHDEASAEEWDLIGFRCARDASVAPTTATPTPTPTPLPSDSGSFGEEGGVLWITHPEHLTVLHVLPGTLSGTMTSEIALSVTYTQSRPAGDLHSMDHFFVVDGPLSAQPVEVLLGFKNSGGMIAGTEGLYRLDATTWVTDHITTTEHSSGHILAWIDQPGLYGILGQTNRTYLPLVLR